MIAVSFNVNKGLYQFALRFDIIFKFLSNKINCLLFFSLTLIFYLKMMNLYSYSNMEIQFSQNKIF